MEQEASLNQGEVPAQDYDDPMHVCLRPSVRKYFQHGHQLQVACTRVIACHAHLVYRSYKNVHVDFRSDKVQTFCNYKPCISGAKGVAVSSTPDHVDIHLH